MLLATLRFCRKPNEYGSYLTVLGKLELYIESQTKLWCLATSWAIGLAPYLVAIVSEELGNLLHGVLFAGAAIVLCWFVLSMWGIIKAPIIETDPSYRAAGLLRFFWLRGSSKMFIWFVTIWYLLMSRLFLLEMNYLPANVILFYLLYFVYVAMWLKWYRKREPYAEVTRMDN